jgi:hypothetical protein
VLDPEPDRKDLRKALRSLSQRFLAFAEARMVQEWAGTHRRDAGCGSGNLEGRRPARPCGGDRLLRPWLPHWPCAGRLAANLITGATPIVDPTEFRFSRFSDGSKPWRMGGI